MTSYISSNDFPVASTAFRETEEAASEMGSLASCRYNQCLAVVTGVCSATSLVCLCIGLATDNWLYAAERVSPDDATVGVNATYRNTTTGLWRKCVDDRKCVTRDVARDFYSSCAESSIYREIVFATYLQHLGRALGPVNAVFRLSVGEFHPEVQSC